MKTLSQKFKPTVIAAALTAALSGGAMAQYVDPATPGLVETGGLVNTYGNTTIMDTATIDVGRLPNTNPGQAGGTGLYYGTLTQAQESDGSGSNLLISGEGAVVIQGWGDNAPNGAPAVPVSLVVNGNAAVGAGTTIEGGLLVNSGGLSVISGAITGNGGATIDGTTVINGNGFYNTQIGGTGVSTVTLTSGGAVTLTSGTSNIITASTGNTITGTTNAITGVTSSLTGTTTATVTGGSSSATLTNSGVAIVGDTSVTGKLSSTGDFSVNTNKFTVNASTGNTAVAGTLDVAGATTLDGATQINNTLRVTGLITGTGGATITGATNINASGSAATTIGNAANTSAVSLISGSSSIVTSNGTNAITGRTGNTVTATTGDNALSASAGSNMLNASNNALTATVKNRLVGGMGNTITATTGGNDITATAGSNTLAANAASQSNTLSATGTNGANNLTANATSGTNSVEAKNNSIGVTTANSINTIGNTSTGTTVTARGGNSTLSVVDGSASLTAGSSLATNGNTGVTSGNLSGGLTVYNAAQTIAAGATIPTTLSPNGILAGKTYQTKVNGNLLVDGNVYINGTLDYVSSNTANTTVIGSTTGVGASVLTGATVATNGGTAIVMKGASGTQTVVDANGKLTNVVVGAAAQSTAALTLTNGIGNTHGVVITETQATLSGGTHSSSLTMADNGATFSDSATGAPVQVHGVNDGTSDFDATNVRQFSSAIASVTAMANIPQVDQDKTYAMGVGLGSFMGKTALAMGVTYRFTKNGVFKGSAASAMNGSNSTAVGVGAAWSY